MGKTKTLTGAGYYGQNKDSNRGRLLAGYGSRWANKGIMVM